MQHATSYLALLPLAAFVATASAETSPEAAACEQLRGLLAREVSILESVQDAASAAAALPQLREVLDALAGMERSYEAEKALWTYIDNTEGVKLPFIELLQRLTIEFTRLEKAHYYRSAPLHALLAPQLRAPEEDKAAGAEKK